MDKMRESFEYKYSVTWLSANEPTSPYYSVRIAWQLAWASATAESQQEILEIKKHYNFERERANKSENENAGLKAKCAELERQVAAFNRRCEAGYNKLDWLDAIETVAEQDKKLAGLQLLNQQYRDELEYFCGRVEQGSIHSKKCYARFIRALATTSPTNALDRHDAELKMRCREEVLAEFPYRIYKDGSAWCAVKADFINLQESIAGFGGSPMEALGELIVQEGESK